MSVVDAVKVTICTILIILGMIFLPIIIINAIDSIVEGVRRRKHPKYFEYYDTAISESFRIGGKLSSVKKYIEFHIKLYSDGYRDGECTVESITKKMSELTKMWIEACDTYNYEKKSIEVLWKKADAYAKEHKLKWGEIY